MWILLILFLGIIITKSIHDLHKFNYNATIQQLQSSNSAVIQDALKDKHPLVIHNVRIKTEDLTHDTLVSRNPGYIVQDQQKQVLLSTLADKDVEQIVFYKNPRLPEDIGLSPELVSIPEPFETRLSCGRQYSLSALKGNNATQVSQNTHDVLLLYQIQCHCTLYLINP